MHDDPNHQDVNSVREGDQHIVASIRQGDHVAFAALFKTFAPLLYRIAFSYLRSDATAKDIVQDIMFSFWKNRQTLIITETLHAYLTSATRKRALKVLVSTSRSDKYVEAYSWEDDIPGMGQHTDDPERQVETNDVTVAIIDAVEKLPERYRRVLMLRATEQLSYPEIAELLGLPLKTVKTQARRGMERLQRVLARYFPLP